MRYGYEETARRAHLPASAPMRMLCGVDLTSSSQGAVNRAHALADALDATLTLVHVLPEDGRVAAFPSVAGQFEVRAHAGELVPTVAGIARESRTDLIVFGAAVARRPAPLIEPAAEQLAHLAHCPVLIVRRGSAAPYRAVLVAAEHSPVFDHIIRAAGAWRLLQRNAVVIMHGFETGHRGLLAGAGLEASAARRNLEEWELAAVRRLRRELDDAGVISDQFRMVFHPARTRRQLQQEVRRLQPDLLVVATADRSALERVMRPRVGNDPLRHNQCDILLGPM